MGCSIPAAETPAHPLSSFLHRKGSRDSMKIIRTSAVLAILFGLVAGLLANGFAHSVSAQDNPASTIRFVHVFAGGGPIDIYVEDDLAVQQLAFGTATKYATFPEGERRVRVVAA